MDMSGLDGQGATANQLAQVANSNEMYLMQLNQKRLDHRLSSIKANDESEYTYLSLFEYTFVGQFYFLLITDQSIY